MQLDKKILPVRNCHSLHHYNIKMLCVFQKSQSNKKKDVEFSEEGVIISFIILWVEVKPVFQADTLLNKHTMLDDNMLAFNTCKQVMFSALQYFHICKEYGKMTEKFACRIWTSI